MNRTKQIYTEKTFLTRGQFEAVRHVQKHGTAPAVAKAGDIKFALSHAAEFTAVDLPWAWLAVNRVEILEEVTA
jgi:hypothetical protein